ncbi:MAG: polysaccharide deacetylase family protein [Bacteroidota bacterium]|nr:polysaccharide deacetylase family protein [Bacteroidota bacterium]
MFSYTIPQLLQIVAKSYTWKVKTRDKKLFLTFDDGPHPNITLWVMAQLAEYNARATFFCVGENVKKYPETYKELLKMKHAVGNHTYHHIKGWNTPDDDYLEDIHMASKFIHSPLFRPPYGRILPSQTKKLLSNYQVIMWNYLSGDFDENLNREKSLQVMKRAEPGSIMVFHDSEKAFENLQYLLPKILAYFSEQGYTFESIPYLK